MRSSPRAGLRKGKKYERQFGLFLFFGLLLAALIILSPRQPTQRALNIGPNGEVISAHEGLVISEVMSANASAFPDEEGKFSDWMELWNSTSEPMNLKDITLSNRSDKAKFIFPDHILPPDGRVIVFCDKTNQNMPGRPYHAKFKISSLACSLFIFDTRGFVLDAVDVPTLNSNEVYQRMPDGSFEKGEYYSPGFPNTLEGHQAYLSQFVFETGDLMINELMPAPRSGLRDEDGDLSDWLELKNNSDKDIMLENLALSDNPLRPVKWVFPEGSFIPAHGYYVVFCSGKDRMSPQGYPHTNFSLAAEGETVTLSTRQGQMVDSVQYSLVPADQSYGRDEDGESWRVFEIGTPGAPNTAEGALLADKYLRSLNPTGVYISEVMSSNDSVVVAPDVEPCDWAELYNSTDTVQNLSGYGLSDSVNWPRRWRFPEGTYIYPGEHKTILLDKSKTPGTNAAQLHGSFAIKRMGGEVMTFSDPEGNVLDRIVLPEIPMDFSYGRTPEREGFFYFEAPSPGAANGPGFLGFAKRPEMSKSSGLYKDNIFVELTAEEGAQIRYTLDGAIPTLDNSAEYTAPLEIKDTCVLRVRAFKPGLQPSQTVTATYVMKTYYTLPVVSLVMDPDQLWNPKTGIYATGVHEDGRPIDLREYRKIVFSNPTPTYRLVGKKARHGYAEMFTQDGQVVFSQGVRAGLIGQYSLDMPQKSFKVMAKAGLGTRYFNAALFEDRPFTQYKSFVLRNSGNDQVWTRMADGVQSRLIDRTDSTVIHQAWHPVIVYLNGAYWGHYNMRERVSRYFVAQHEGMSLDDADSVTILEANSKPYWGNPAEYKELIKKVKTLSPGTNLEDLQYILDRVDVDNYFDFQIFQAFFANTDSGNIRYYKTPGGKWKWIIYDLDYGLFNSGANGVKITLNPGGAGTHIRFDNTLIVKLLENDQMRDKYLRRFGEIFQILSTDTMLEQIQICYDILEPEMPMHFERWAAQNLKSIDVDQPQTVDGCLRYWNSRVDRLRNVVRKRPTICWDQVKEWFKLTDQQMIEYFGPRPDFPPGTIM